MKRFTRLLAASTASLAIAGAANAQFGAPQPGIGTLSGPLAGASAPAYDHHWAQAAGEPSFLFAGQAMWVFFNNGAANVGGPGDGIRICYGLDQTQGGRNWSGPGASAPGPYSGLAGLPSGGMTENTWFRWTQGFAATDAGVDLGLISVASASTSARGNDACFAPFFLGFSGPDSGGFKLGSVAIGGLFAATSVAPFPIFWEFTLAWGPTPVLLPNKVGNDSLDPGIPTFDLNGDTTPDPVAKLNSTGVDAPLLANVIYEVQAPVNSALNNSDEQYYLASTVDYMAVNAIPTPAFGYVGSGGATANGNQAFDIFGANAGVTSATNAGRVLTASPSGGFINVMPGIAFPANQPGPPFANFRDGRFEFTGQLAFAATRLWAYHNFNGSPGGIGNTLGMPVSFSALGANHTPPGAPTGPFLSSIVFGSPIGTALPLLEGRDGDNGFLLFTGSGGPDWAAATVPLSRIDLIGIDHEGGADAWGKLYYKVGTYVQTTPTSTTFTPGSFFTGPNAAGFDMGTGLSGFYFGFYSGSCKAATLMAYTWTCQLPHFGLVNSPHPQLSGMMSFDAGAAAFVDGDPLSGFGSAVTTREGTQVLPQISTGDLCFFGFLGIGSFTFSSGISPSDDFFADGPLDYSGQGALGVPSFSSIFEGLWAAPTSGQTDLEPGGAQLFVGFGQGPFMQGLTFHLAGQAVNVNFCAGGAAFITEVTNGLTLNTQ